METKLVGDQGNFDALTEIVIRLLLEFEYTVGPKTTGAGYEDRSKEHWTHQFVDNSGNEVLFYDFKNSNGVYIGELRVNLPPEQKAEFEEQAGGLIASLSDYAVS